MGTTLTRCPLHYRTLGAEHFGETRLSGAETEPWTESRRGAEQPAAAPPPPAVIYWYPMALGSPSSDPSAIHRAEWRREAVTAPLVTGVRLGDITSPLFPC